MMNSGQHRWVLSGGLASGKSKVGEMLALAGVVTVDADRIGRELLDRGGAAFGEVADRWPQAVNDVGIDRPMLASIVFRDQGELAALESITHPHIFDTIKRQVEEVDGPVVVEVPLLHHGLGRAWRRLVVDCRDEIRVKRAIARGMSEDDVRSRMSVQPSRAEWLGAADLVLQNHGTLETLREAIPVVLEQL